MKVSLPGMVILNSKPGGGKSHLARYVFYLYRAKFAHGIVFSKSAFRPGNIDYVPNYSGDVKDNATHMNFKHMRYNKEVLREFLAGQARYPEGQRPLGFVYVDDDVSEPGMFKDEAMIDAATMYRQYNIFIIVCTQYVNLISTTFRECATQVGLFKMDSERSINAAFESYGQDFDDYKTFKRWLLENTHTLHNFCWKDKFDDTPWEILMAPAQIPRFRLEYGRRQKEKKVSRKRKDKGPKAQKNPFLQGMNDLSSVLAFRGNVPPQKKQKRE